MYILFQLYLNEQKWVLVTITTVCVILNLYEIHFKHKILQSFQYYKIKENWGCLALKCRKCIIKLSLNIFIFQAHK